MSYISSYFPIVFCSLDMCSLFPFNFGGLSVCREAVRGFATMDTISLMVWGAVEMALRKKGRLVTVIMDGMNLNIATFMAYEISL